MGSALLRATVTGTVLQLAMVLSGHFVSSISQLFAPMGMGLSLIAGLLFGVWERPDGARRTLQGGVIAGGTCALIGIAVSWALGDVTALVLVLGTLSSAVTGTLGALIGWRVSRSSGVPVP